MSRTATITVDASGSKEVWAPCATCDQDTCHVALAVVEEYDTSNARDIHVTTDFEIVRCGGCRTISFRKNWTSSEDLEWDDQSQTESAIEHPEVFPPRVAGRRALRDIYSLPPKIRSIYSEAHAALCNSSRILAGIGLRAIVEALCAHQKASGRDLKSKIDDLVRLGVLTTAGALVLHGTRLVGNEAAHEVVPPSERTLSAAFDVVEHLLTTVYILPEKAVHLPKAGATP